MIRKPLYALEDLGAPCAEEDSLNRLRRQPKLPLVVYAARTMLRVLPKQVLDVILRPMTNLLAMDLHRTVTMPAAKTIARHITRLGDGYHRPFPDVARKAAKLLLLFAFKHHIFWHIGFPKCQSSAAGREHLFRLEYVQRMRSGSSSAFGALPPTLADIPADVPAVASPVCTGTEVTAQITFRRPTRPAGRTIASSLKVTTRSRLT